MSVRVSDRSRGTRTVPAPAAHPDRPDRVLLRTAAAPTPRRQRTRSAARFRPAARRSSRKLLDIVRERTGYPPEVLRLDLDLEADLGIDSIKRVEILGKLRDAFPQLGTASDPEAMDRLVSARTLAAIVDRVERSIGKTGSRDGFCRIVARLSRHQPGQPGTASCTAERAGCSWRRWSSARSVGRAA